MAEVSELPSAERAAEAPAPVPPVVRCALLLGGAVRAGELMAASGRSVFELPLDADNTLLDHWRRNIANLAVTAECASIPVRVVSNQRRGPTPLGVSRPRASGNGTAFAAVSEVSFECEPNPLRGTAGLLRDLTRGYSPDDRVLVVTGPSLLWNRLHEVYRPLADCGADVALLAGNDGTYGGVMLARVGAFDAVSEIGYVDLKQQALPAIAQRGKVNVVREPDTRVFPIRSRADYLAALRAYHGSVVESGVTSVDRWKPVFGFSEPRARVGTKARLLDSVVLSGASVGAGATVVRSLVCSGAEVRPGEVVVDRVVALGGRFTATASARWRIAAAY